MNRKLTRELVEAEVGRCWHTIASNDTQRLRRMYSIEATVFQPRSQRHELGPSTATRCAREYSDPDCKVTFRLGEIHVVLLGEHAEAAVASYTFEFHAINVITALGIVDRHVHNGRATQVFAYDADGAIVIMHDHRSEMAIAPKAQSAPPDVLKNTIATSGLRLR